MIDIIPTIILSAISLNSVGNLMWLHLNSKKTIINKEPFISILIPARNEEKNIEKCLKSIIKQNYRNYEIIIGNDQSMDLTANIVNEISKYNKKIKIIEIPSQKGWVGKNYNCHILSKSAKSDIFFFIDADTELIDSNTLSICVSKLKNENLAALSLIQKQICINFWEKIIVPFRINYLILFFLPLYINHKSTAAAQGNFILISKAAYEAVGGHEKLKSEICEDIFLMKNFRSNGYKTKWVDGSTLSQTRMYENFKSISEGFIKNYYPNFFKNIFAVITFILLHLLILASLFTPAVLINVCLLTYITLLTLIRFKSFSLMGLLFAPLGILINIYLLIISTYKYLSKKKISWSGRDYSV